MKIRESMLALLLCAGLIVTFGLTACGDDDDVLECAEALVQLQDSACEAAVTAGIDVLRDCLLACGGDPVCEDVCEDTFEATTSVCEPAASILSEGCGCQVCANNFESCIAGADPAGDCVDDIVDCFGDCVL
jgi:hypothetical protein